MDLRVRSGQGDYRVESVSSLAELRSRVESVPRAVLVVDAEVRRLHGGCLEGLSAPIREIQATEAQKSLPGVESLARWLGELGVGRQTHLIAMGGGITQDLASFTARIFQRGIRWSFVPTTLLSMADSCIGAKCGVNLGSAKNQLGAFHSPSFVWVHEGFLATLAEREIMSGFGEILKLSLTGLPGFFRALDQGWEGPGTTASGITPWIERSLEAKRRVIEEDEYEADRRRILNYGHSFGHALEAVSGFEVPHGIAVAWGVDVANFLAWEKGWIEENAFLSVHRFFERHFSSAVERAIDPREIVRAMGSDKKASAGTITLALPRPLGNLVLVPTALDQALESALTRYLRSSWDSDVKQAA